MINIQDKSACSGCTACSAVCGRNAITMTPDGMGFKYPVVDMEKCVECGLCEKVCAFKPITELPKTLILPGYTPPVKRKLLKSRKVVPVVSSPPSVM